MKSLCGIQIRKVINESYKCYSDHWMQTKYDDNVLDYWRLPNGNYIVKVKQGDGLEGDNNVKSTLPSHLGAFTSSKSIRIISNLIREKNGFYKIVYNTQIPIFCL